MVMRFDLGKVLKNSNTPLTNVASYDIMIVGTYEFRRALWLSTLLRSL